MSQREGRGERERERGREQGAQAGRREGKPAASSASSASSALAFSIQAAPLPWLAALQLSPLTPLAAAPLPEQVAARVCPGLGGEQLLRFCEGVHRRGGQAPPEPPAQIPAP